MINQPRQIGPYRVQRQIGQGMAQVFLATHPRQGQVALKLLPPAYTRQREAEARFRREARVLQRLRHPNILRLYESGIWQPPGTSDRCYFLAAEYLPDGTLEALLRSYPRGMPEAQALPLAIQIADALAYAHDQNVVHRDLKPSNIMLRGGQVVLGDFGIARELAERTIGQGQRIVGTLAYMSPEQTWGSAQAVGRGSDIYSFGVLCYELLAGSQPRNNPELPDVVVIQMIRDTPLPPLAQVAPSVSPEVAAIIQRCLEPQRGQRYATMQQVAGLLRQAAFQRGQPVPGQAPAMRPPAPRAPWLLVGLVGIAAALLLAIALVLALALLPGVAPL
ncbi:MAG TPA: serine/threonine-protein kinase [Chloroflexaceae bacterium]|nr:serine/threonine-protein kinase [Chloroflexaceae bacterium]